MIKTSKEIAELCGMHAGDGTLYKTSRGLVWEMRGDLLEKEYYTDHVAPLLKSITNEVFQPKFRSGGKNGCFGIQTSNKILTNLIVQLGFNPGTKTYTVRIPEYVINADNKIKLSFVRGLFDTDGCIRFERINNNILHTYPKIEFTSASKKLIEDLFSLLQSLGFKPNIWGNKYFKLCISGKNQLKRFMSEVSPKNKKHLKKYQFWKDKGYYLPRSLSLAIAVIL